jgi:hypothetical protein
MQAYCGGPTFYLRTHTGGFSNPNVMGINSGPENDKDLHQNLEVFDAEVARKLTNTKLKDYALKSQSK